MVLKSASAMTSKVIANVGINQRKQPKVFNGRRYGRGTSGFEIRNFKNAAYSINKQLQRYEKMVCVRHWFAD